MPWLYIENHRNPMWPVETSVVVHDEQNSLTTGGCLLLQNLQKTILGLLFKENLTERHYCDDAAVPQTQKYPTNPAAIRYSVTIFPGCSIAKKRNGIAPNAP